MLQLLLRPTYGHGLILWFAIWPFLTKWRQICECRSFWQNATPPGWVCPKSVCRSLSQCCQLQEIVGFLPKLWNLIFLSQKSPNCNEIAKVGNTVTIGDVSASPWRTRTEERIGRVIILLLLQNLFASWNYSEQAMAPKSSNRTLFLYSFGTLRWRQPPFSSVSLNCILASCTFAKHNSTSWFLKMWKELLILSVRS